MKKTLTFSRATNMSATQSAETDYLDSYFYCRHRLIWWNTAHIKTFFGAVHTVGYSRSLYRTVMNQSMLYFNIKTSFSDTSVQIDWINRGLSKVFISFVNLTYQTSTSRSNPIFFQITFFLISENVFFSRHRSTCPIFAEHLKNLRHSVLDVWSRVPHYDAPEDTSKFEVGERQPNVVSLKISLQFF